MTWGLLFQTVFITCLVLVAYIIGVKRGTDATHAWYAKTCKKMPEGESIPTTREGSKHGNN